MSAVVQQDYRFLKIVVAAMGIVLMAGFAVIVATLLKRAAARPEARETLVALPEAMDVVETQIGAGSIVLHLKGEAGESLIILDAKSGAETGRVALVPSHARDR